MRQRIDEVPRYLAIPASFRFTFQVSGTVEARVLRPSPPFLGEKGSNPTRKERTFGPSQFASRLPHDTGPTQAHFAKAPALQNRPIHSDPSHMPPQQLVAGSDVSSVHDALVDTTSSIDSPLSRLPLCLARCHLPLRLQASQAVTTTRVWLKQRRLDEIRINFIPQVHIPVPPALGCLAPARHNHDEMRAISYLPPTYSHHKLGDHRD